MADSPLYPTGGQTKVKTNLKDNITRTVLVPISDQHSIDHTNFCGAKQTIAIDKGKNIEIQLLKK